MTALRSVSCITYDVQCCREPELIPARIGREDEEGASVSSRALGPIHDKNVKKIHLNPKAGIPEMDMNAILTVSQCRRISTTEESI